MKPDWKDSPSWARYIAMDQDRWWWWHEERPRWDEGRRQWESEGRTDIACSRDYDPRTTLEERPQ